MRRKTFDLLAIIGGLVLTVVLAVAGGLLLWGHNFVSDQVHTQLAAQKIYFPPAGSGAIKALPAADAKAMTAYAGQQMTAALAAQVQTVFRGETLRGLLLNAYGFWQMGQIMLIGAIVAFVAAAALLILSLFGIAHRHYVPAEEEVFAGRAPAHETA